MIQERTTLIRRVFIGLDICLISLLFNLAIRLQNIEPILSIAERINGFQTSILPSSFYLSYMISAAVIWVSALYYYGGYSSIRKMDYPSLAWMVCKSVVMATIVFGMLAFIVNATEVMSRSFILLFFLCTLVFLLFERFVVLHFLHSIRRKGHSCRKFLIVGSGPRAKRFARLLQSHREWGLKVIGFVDEPKRVGNEIDGKKVFGSIDELETILDTQVVDEVVFIMPRSWMHKAEKYIMMCEDVGVKATVALDLFNTAIAKPRLKEFGAFPLLCMEPVPSKMGSLLVKRCMDILISGATLLILSPLFLIVAVFIKLTSPGPVVLKQERTGQNGRKFTMYKFRTMVVGAEKMLDEIKALNESKGPVFHSRSDPRVTKAGKYIRKFSLDELPQLWNVFKGDMSIVGPRPPLPNEVIDYERWQRRRLSLKPGLVCLWQVTKRYSADFEEWVKTDLGYIDNWSLSLDFKILMKVLPAIYKGARHWNG